MRPFRSRRADSKEQRATEEGRRPCRQGQEQTEGGGAGATVLGVTVILGIVGAVVFGLVGCVDNAMTGRNGNDPAGAHDCWESMETGHYYRWCLDENDNVITVHSW